MPPVALRYGPMVELSHIDLAVVAGYLLVVLAFGLWAGRGERDAADYFLAGRALPWYLIGLSFFASNMSGASFVGLMGAAYEQGMVVFNYEWTATAVLIVFALVMLPVFLRAGLFTVPEYLEARFCRRARWLYAGFTILTLLFIDTAGALYAGGVVISTAWPQVSLWQTSAALAALAGAYTLFGGLRRQAAQVGQRGKQVDRFDEAVRRSARVVHARHFDDQRAVCGDFVVRVLAEHMMLTELRM